MIKKPITINLSTGLEARPVAQLVQVASQFNSEIYVEIGKKRVNAKSIMGMMTLGLDAGEEITLSANGEAIDREKIKVIVSILPEDIDMSDDEEAGIICGHIINLIYKGDHYSYVVRTDNEEDFIVDDEYLWNMEDRVSLIIPEDKMKFSLKK